MTDLKQRSTDTPDTTPTKGQPTQDSLQDPLAGETQHREWQGGEPTMLTAQRGGGGGGDKPKPSKLKSAFEAGGFEAARGQYGSGSTEDLSATGKLTTPRRFGTGSATVAAGVKVNGGVNDAWSMSTQYQAERSLDPSATEDQLWQRAVDNDANPAGTLLRWSPEAPPVTGGVSMPIDNTRVDRPTTPPARKAVVIGNGDYADNTTDKHIGVWDDLPGATADAKLMANTLDGQGFDVDHHENLTASSISAAFDKGMAGAMPGDEIVLYYSGHGVQRGLVGVSSKRQGKDVSDVAAYTSIAKYATKAVSGGFHVRIIADACESEALAQRVAEEGLNEGQGEYDQTWKIGNPYDAAIDPKRSEAIQEAINEKFGTDVDGDFLHRVVERQFDL